MELQHVFCRIKIRKENILPVAACFSVLYEFNFYLLRYMLPESVFRLYSMALPAALVCEGLILLDVVLNGDRWRSLLLLNLCCLLASRLLLGDFAFSAWSAVHWAILFVCFFHCFTALNAKQKDLLYAVITLELTGLLALWAVLGILTAIMGHPVAGFEEICFSVEHTDPPLVFITFFGLHRNLSAAYFVCTAGMLLYHCRKTRAPLWRGLTILFLPLAFCAVALQHSRSNYLAFAVLLGLVLVCSLRQLRRWPRGLAGQAAALCALALSVSLLYMGMGAASDGITALSRAFRTQEQAETIGTEGETAAESEPAPVISDPRSTLEDSRTLTGRSSIWKSALLTIREKPSIALLGLPMGSIMTRVNQFTGIPNVHMHNALMQQLMTSGVPGLVIYCLFFLSLLKKIALVFGCGGKEKGLERQILGMLLSAMLVYSFFEPLLCQRIPVPSLLFCMSAGLLVS
ncbi:MAG: O-antigen ligase family protein [Oscillospiraceae bacterium]|nr:O-antigen ligase family protein [Oscillospiraceae bacterium]